MLIAYHRLSPVVHFAGPCGRESGLVLWVCVEGEEGSKPLCFRLPGYTFLSCMLQAALVLALKTGRVNALCSRIRPGPAAPFQGRLLQPNSPDARFPEGSRKNPLLWIFGSKDVTRQSAESMCCSRKRNLISAADVTQAKLLFEVRRSLCEGGLG